MHDAQIVQAISHGWSGQDRATILEMDFGQGAFFLKLWETWWQHPKRPQRLHVIGLLPFLSAHADLHRLLLETLSHPAQVATQSARDTRCEALLAQWPLNLPGLHRLEFASGALTLTLAVGPAETVLGRLRANVDAFVLTKAFATHVPEPLQIAAHQIEIVQPESDPFFRQLSKLAAPSAQAFYYSGQGVSGIKAIPITPDAEAERVTHAAWVQSPTPAALRHVIVVGAGFAGMGVAQSLALRGWRVTVVDAQWGDPHATHAQHSAAALTPMVARDDNIRARLSRAGSLRAQVRWGDLPESVVLKCGAIQLQRDQGRIVDLAAALDALKFPSEWVRNVTAEQARAISGLPLKRGGIYFPGALRIHPQGLIHALALTPGIAVMKGRVEQLVARSGRWQALDCDGRVIASAPHIVLASGLHTQTVLANSSLLEKTGRLAAMHALGGEISFVPASALGGGPRCIVAGDGYVLPAQAGECVIGSTYAHAAKQVLVTQDGMTKNVARAAGLLNIPELSEGLSHLPLRGWAGWRAVLPGRLPSIGPVAHAPGVWVACGFASRGLTWAALAGDLIAGALNGEPVIVENDIMHGTSDN